MTRSALLLLLLAPVANAATFNVTRTDDPLPNGCAPGDCSLREAVLAANLLAGADTVVLGASTYNLTRIDPTPASRENDRGPLRVDQHLVIQGVTRDSTRVRWNSVTTSSDPLLATDYDVTSPVTLQLNALTVSHGRGSCIRMNMTGVQRHWLMLTQARVERCTTTGNGGGANLGRTNLAMHDVQIRNNTAGADGGALHLHGGTYVESSNAVLSGNVAKRHGGAVDSFGIGLLGQHSDIVWVDYGGSSIHLNRADGDGGGIHLWNTSSLDLSSIAGVTPMAIEANTATGRGGGVSLAAGMTDFTSTNRLARVRITDNRAGAGGGGVHSEVSVNLEDAEIASNLTSAGSGGGVLLEGQLAWPGGRRLERVSVHGNVASAGIAGAIASGCTSFALVDSALFDNQAATGEVQALYTVAQTELRHVTITGHKEGDGPAIGKKDDGTCPNTSVQYANSLIDGSCVASVTTQLASVGGNQLGDAAATCPDLPGLDQRPGSAAFALTIAPFGGAFDVPGWYPDGIARPQQDSGLTMWCSALDVRGVARVDGRCDAGAFEGGTP